MILFGIVGGIDLPGRECFDSLAIEFVAIVVNHRDEFLKGLIDDVAPELPFTLFHRSKGIECILERAGFQWVRGDPIFLGDFAEIVTGKNDTDGTRPGGRFGKDPGLGTSPHRDVIPP